MRFDRQMRASRPPVNKLLFTDLKAPIARGRDALFTQTLFPLRPTLLTAAVLPAQGGLCGAFPTVSKTATKLTAIAKAAPVPLSSKPPHSSAQADGLRLSYRSDAIQFACAARRLHLLEGRIGGPLRRNGRGWACLFEVVSTPTHLPQSILLPNSKRARVTAVLPAALYPATKPSAGTMLHLGAAV